MENREPVRRVPVVPLLVVVVVGSALALWYAIREPARMRAEKIAAFNAGTLVVSPLLKLTSPDVGFKRQSKSVHVEESKSWRSVQRRQAPFSVV